MSLSVLLTTPAAQPESRAQPISSDYSRGVFIKIFLIGLNVILREKCLKPINDVGWQLLI